MDSTQTIVKLMDTTEAGTTISIKESNRNYEICGRIKTAIAQIQLNESHNLILIILFEPRFINYIQYFILNYLKL